MYNGIRQGVMSYAIYDNKEKVLDALKNGDLITILSTTLKISNDIFVDADKKYNIIKSLFAQ